MISGSVQLQDLPRYRQTMWSRSEAAHLEHEVIGAKASQAADHTHGALQLIPPLIWLKRICLQHQVLSMPRTSYHSQAKPASLS